MSNPKIMVINVAGYTVRAKMMEEDNSDVVNLVCSHLPLTSFALHTNVSGHGFFFPTMISYTGTGNMVPRHPGAVYLFAQGHNMVFTYGETSESAYVNKFAQIFDQDLPKLASMGKAIYDNLITAQHNIIRATVHLSNTDQTPSRVRDLAPAKTPPFDRRWKSIVSIFLTQAKLALEEEPDEVFLTSRSIIPSGMGTGGNAYAVWVHQFCCLISIGPNTLHRFLADAGLPGMTLDLMVAITRNHLLNPFNYFEFLNDLGLTRFKAWGDMYTTGLEDINSIQDYKLLTTALLSLVNVYRARVQSRFPLYLSKCCPRVNKEEVLRLASMLEPTLINYAPSRNEN